MAARGEPYLSLVVAARNDDHGGNMLARMQGMLDSWIGQAERYGLQSEIVVVEWNPPADRPRLKDSLRWPSQPKYCEVRLIEVPAGCPCAIQERGRYTAASDDREEYGHPSRARRVCARHQSRYHLFGRVDGVPRGTPSGKRRDVQDRSPRCRQRCPRRRIAQRAPDFLRKPHAACVCARRRISVVGQWATGAGPAGHCGPDAGVRFGAGWSSVECSDRQRYRWLESEAELYFERPAAAPGLTLHGGSGTQRRSTTSHSADSGSRPARRLQWRR